MSAPEPNLPKTEAEIFAAGWAAGAQDTVTPAIRQRLTACGLPLHLGGLAKQQQNEPLDAA